MKNYKIYCAGEFIETNNILEVRNPYDNELIATTYLADKKILESAIEKALSVEKECREMPSYLKYRILMQIVHQMKDKKKELAEVLCLESAKPLKYGLGEIDRAIQTFLVAAEESKRLPKEYISIDWTPAGERREGLVKYFPVGLSAGISPFNFPMNLAVHKIAPSIAAGCPMILKPSRNTPLSNLELSKIMDETDLPKGAISILPMDRESGNQLVTDDRFKLLTFTGSPEVGWKMKADAGKKKTILELGGNAAAIITQSCDFDMALKRCLMGSFSYSGQVCIHLQRMYVHDSIFNKFRDKFIEATAKLKKGHPLDKDTDISAMIDEENAVRVEEWVKEAVDQGAELLIGGERKGTYFEPTVLTKTNNRMKVSFMEVFGPVVTLEPYSDYKDAVVMVNDSKYGLQAGVFTDSVVELDYAFNEINVGGVIHNDVPTFRVDHMPYGGVKDSGMGREGVKYAIYDMLEAKVLVKPY
jgi:glyceraldehyde-3-phosphate dehydrogenase (NADP+)